jgi:hypothetical protein
MNVTVSSARRKKCITPGKVRCALHLARCALSCGCSKPRSSQPRTRWPATLVGVDPIAGKRPQSAEVLRRLNARNRARGSRRGAVESNDAQTRRAFVAGFAQSWRACRAARSRLVYKYSMKRATKSATRRIAISTGKHLSRVIERFDSHRRGYRRPGGTILGPRVSRPACHCCPLA